MLYIILLNLNENFITSTQLLDFQLCYMTDDELQCIQGGILFGAIVLILFCLEDCDNIFKKIGRALRNGIKGKSSDSDSDIYKLDLGSL